ncbi:MAG: hypothetical protein EXS13_06420 [Planctomycetes bacterium]|nr:hypothetical protein [Planctomycetota bacterium]
MRDVDGDGVAELVVACPWYWEPTQGRETGRVVLLSGASGTIIWSLVGEQSADNFGSPMICVGDIDGDGFDEILVSSADQGTLNLGRVYVVSTDDAHVIRSHMGSLSGERLGTALSRCKDVDGDGVVDYAVSTQLIPDSNRGRIDVYSGASGALLWSKTGDVNDGLGTFLNSAGDWDGDGRGDLVA